ncbi:MAG: DUF1592 domain-containing protein [Planctomycetaceae bacterium]
MRRLTRYELQYALEDLLKMSVREEVDGLPEEAASLETGLQNNAQSLMVSGPQLEAYLNVILSVINKASQLATLKPQLESLDLGKVDTSRAKNIASSRRSNRLPAAGVERAGEGLRMLPNGHVDLTIPAISQGTFEISVTANADAPAQLQVRLWCRAANEGKRPRIVNLGSIDIAQGQEVSTYSLRAHPNHLPGELTRIQDRPFVVRVSNPGSTSVTVESLEYRGNIDAESLLLPNSAQPAGSGMDSHIRPHLKTFIERVFRRSPTDAELDRYCGSFRGHLDANAKDTTRALLRTYQEILCSPRFFYLGLPGDLSEEANRNYQLAERLAFFLWCSVPDDQLLEAASAGQLTTPTVLAAYVERMLKDERSRRWVEHFADQWLQISQLFNVAVDEEYYPQFDDSLKELMHQETIEAVNDVFRQGSSALDLLNSDHVFVNERLARFYGIEGVTGEEFRKVPVDAQHHRGGLLTQGTFLVGNSDGMDSHAILRGVWLSAVILSDPPPAPPKGVPPLDETIPGFDRMTLNEKLFIHRNHVACASCHQKIDPWGIPFENYDASGAWREQALVVSETPNPPGKKKKKQPAFERAYLPIDRSATLPDGTTVDGILELKDHLLNHHHRDFARGLAARILACALSRDIDSRDNDLIERLVQGLEQSNYSVPALIRDIVQSEPFQTVQGQGDPFRKGQ